MGAIHNPRPSPIAGTWYPGDPQQLAGSIDGYLAEATSKPIKGRIKAIMVPHAGHRYSGHVAAYAYNSIRGLPTKHIAVISPMHQYFPARLLTTAHDAYETPLGTVKVSQEMVRQLDQFLNTSLGEGLTRIARDQEHSLEIQLPFLQRVYPEGFDLLPVMLRDQSPDITHTLAEALARVLPEDSMLVASSDLSHFYSADDASLLDNAVLEAIHNFSPDELYRVEAESRGFACGLGAIACILWAARIMGADQAEILNQGTSGDITGDRSSVVGYASAVVYQNL